MILLLGTPQPSTYLSPQAYNLVYGNQLKYIATVKREIMYLEPAASKVLVVLTAI